MAGLMDRTLPVLFMMMTWDDAHTDIMENANIIEGDNYCRTKSLHASLEFSRKKYTYICQPMR
jgi:hypothetical protein